MSAAYSAIVRSLENLPAQVGNETQRAVIGRRWYSRGFAMRLGLNRDQAYAVPKRFGGVRAKGNKTIASNTFGDGRRRQRTFFQHLVDAIIANAAHVAALPAVGIPHEKWTRG
jgi:hypothetical protein